MRIDSDNNMDELKEQVESVTGAASVSAAGTGGALGMGGVVGQGGRLGQGANLQYSIPGILHFLQHEWSRFEMERGQWEVEKAELQVSVANPSKWGAGVK